MKAKISKSKRNNQTKNKLFKQKKIKNKKSKKRQKNVKKVQHQNILPAPVSSDEEEKIDEIKEGEEFLGMMEKDDLDFIKESLINRSYSIFKKIRVSENEKKPNRKRKKTDDEDAEDIEKEYEENSLKNTNSKKVKMMLPVKTKEGIVEQTIEVDENENIENEKETKSEENNEENGDEEDSDAELFKFEDVEEVQKKKQLTTADILAIREKTIDSIRQKVGVICSGLLENPEVKINNIRLLFNLMDHAKPEVYISTKKIVSVSLLEVFKDLLPGYAIREQNTKDVKMKKDTLKLVKFEEKLLQMYKGYLQRLERILRILTPKKGNTVKRTPQEIKLAKIALNCLCELLITHSYFNYSKNIVQAIVPFLNHRLPDVREMVKESIKKIFKNDKKGEITLMIMRKINLLVKLKATTLHTDVLETLLSLKIKDINLDEEREQNIKQKKLISHKHRVLQLSKKERKRKKKLEQLNKELLETQAEENKSERQKLLTEVTKILFTIYFRILKQYPNSKILSITLEGLAKFAHCINIDFYLDLVNVISQLLDENQLGYREQLHCVLTVITILSGQGDVLNIDPQRFYTHLYKNLFEFHAGHSHQDCEILLETLDLVLIKRRKKLTQQRLFAFSKRLVILSLICLHNGSLGCLSIVKKLFQLSKSMDILLDIDPSVGGGHYLPEIDDPEYANASNSALWELSLLDRHYHPLVRQLAKYIETGVPAAGDLNMPTDLKTLPAVELFKEYDSSEMAFKPAIIPPKITTPTSKVVKTMFVNKDFEEYCKNVAIKPVQNHYFYLNNH